MLVASHRFDSLTTTKVKFGIFAPPPPSPTCTFYSPSTGCISGRQIRCQIPRIPSKGTNDYMNRKKTKGIRYKCGNNDGNKVIAYLLRFTVTYHLPAPPGGSSDVHPRIVSEKTSSEYLTTPKSTNAPFLMREPTFRSSSAKVGPHNIHHHTQRHTGAATARQPCCYFVR